MRFRGAARPYVLAAVGYAVVTAAIFYNLIPVIATRIYSGRGDALLNASILYWNAHHLPLSAAWWNYPAFAPLPGVTAWTEHLLAAYPLTTPIILVTGNPLLAYNVLLLTCFVLNALAMFALVRDLTTSDAAAFVAGLAFAFAPYQGRQVAHVQMLMAFGMPLALRGLHQYVEHGRRRGLAWFTAGWLSVSLSNAYLLLFFPVFIALWCVWFARGRWARLVPIGTAAVLVVIAVAPLLWGYHVRQAAYGFTRSYEEIRSFGADVRSLANVANQNILWGRVLNTTSIEGSLFPGLAIVALAMVGVARHVRGAWTRRDPIIFYALAAVAMWLLALGPEPAWNGMRILAYGPYRLLLLLPGGTSVRVPARIWLIAVMSLAVAAGGGAAWVGSGRRRHLAWLLASLILAEGWFTDKAYDIPLPAPGAIPREAIVLDLPIGAVADNMPAQYLAVTHGYRVVNGYSGYAPPHFAALREKLARHDSEAFNAFRRVADLYVIVRPAVEAPFLRWMASEPGARELAGTGDARLYVLPRIGEAHEVPFHLQ
jgi:hypothetical protein